MEWAEAHDGPGSWWELRSGDDVLATAWVGIGCEGWWTIGDDLIGTMAPSLDDAKDAAWEAVYRSTR